MHQCINAINALYVKRRPVCRFFEKRQKNYWIIMSSENNRTHAMKLQDWVSRLVMNVRA